MKPFIARNEDYTMCAFNLFKGNLEFRPLYSVSPSFTEKEYLFSYAISKYQHLVIFEE